MAIGSSSKITRWRRCRRKAWYNDVLKIGRIAQLLAPHKGKLIHAAIQNHYENKDWTKPIQDVKIDLEKVFDEEREEWVKLKDEAYRIVRGYLLAYREIDKDIKTLFTEKQFEIPLGKHLYTGTIDWGYEDAVGLWIADHKTTKTIPPVEQLYMDLQTVMYYHVAKVLKLNPVGVVFNHIRTKAPRRPQILKNGQVSRAACDTDIATYFETVRQAGFDVKEYEDMIPKLKGNVFYRRSRLPVSDTTVQKMVVEIEATLNEMDFYFSKAKELGSKAEQLFPRTMIRDRCGWDCDYYQICIADLAGQNTQGIIDEYYEEREERYDDEEA